VGATAPRAVVVLPVLFEGRALGVIEFGAVTRFSELHLTFLQRLVVTIGVAIRTIQANRRTEELLAQSQDLAGELQTRSAQLQRTNAELEEKAAQLSQQNRSIEIKNMEIDAARRGVEEQAQQLATASRYKSEFLANMSHELRTPLNSLLLLSRLLADNTDQNLTERQIEFASTIHNAGADLLRLIDDILDLSKIEAGRVDVEPVPVDLAEVRGFVERAFRPQAEHKGLELRVEAAPGLPDEIITDGRRLQQILRNLLSNAVKFTAHGSVVLSMAPAAEAVRGPAGDEGPMLAFTVRDTGIGIAHDKLAMIFEAFQQADGTTSRKYGGTGLGLSISRELARLLGGAITVSSRPGTGSEFTLYLPRTLPQARSAPSRPTQLRPAQLRSDQLLPAGAGPDRIRPVPAPPLGSAGLHAPVHPPESAARTSVPVAPELRRAVPELAGTTVLIVDDDVRNVFALTSALELHGLRVLYADNGTDGIALLTRHPEVDIVLMDAMMPDLDGNETTRLIRRLPEGADLPVVFLTAKAMPGDRESSLAAGASDYVTKPVDLDALLVTIASWVGARARRAAPGDVTGGAAETAPGDASGNASVTVDDERS
jgi:signal transduction histidine kinase/ActR/RegA family two-component response regulator